MSIILLHFLLQWSAKNPRHLQWETRYQSLLAFKVSGLLILLSFWKTPKAIGVLRYYGQNLSNGFVGIRFFHLVQLPPLQCQIAGEIWSRSSAHSVGRRYTTCELGEHSGKNMSIFSSVNIVIGIIASG